jgi:hypothetical protein
MALHGQHAQLSTAENSTTLSILTALFRRTHQVREISFTTVCNIVAFKRAILTF